MSKKYLVTSGLPYANGSIHLGHLVETIQTDVYVRAMKLAGRDVIYVCGDDTHGTPIELNAMKRGLTPEAMIALYEAEHLRDFARFGIEFDGFYSTNHDVNRRLAEEFYGKIKDKGLLEKRSLEQLYCPKDERFLPDRYVRGTCPICSTPDQYGDVCEACGSTYSPTELKQPHCTLCGTTPVLRTSEHLFFNLERNKTALTAWLDGPGRLQSEVRNFVETWLKEGLKDWCITRDGPYFGFKVPDMPNKFFYVWLDAPIGYLGATARTAEARGLKFDDYWRDPNTEIVHLIGKDIVYFHALFWPALLQATGYNLPTKLHVHGMLRVNGEKMSKTRGTFITGQTFAKYVDPQYLRYYYASKLTGKVEDIDLSFTDFVNRVNAELVNKIVNLYSRLVAFVGTRLEGMLSDSAGDSLPEAQEVRRLLTEAEEAYLAIDHARAIAAVLAIADIGNKYFQDNKPWEKIKVDKEGTRAVCTFVANVCQAVTIGIKPVLPVLAAQTETMLAIKPVTFRTPLFEMKTHKLGETARLVERIEQTVMDQIVEESKVAAPVTATTAPLTPIKPEITYDAFSAMDLRAGKILSAERVVKSDKLLKLSVDIGQEKPRQVIAGIGQAYAPETLLGKTVVCLVNLKPAKLMGLESQAMLLAAGPGGKDVNLCELPSTLSPGSLIK